MASTISFLGAFKELSQYIYDNENLKAQMIRYYEDFYGETISTLDSWKSVATLIKKFLEIKHASSYDYETLGRYYKVIEDSIDCTFSITEGSTQIVCATHPNKRLLHFEVINNCLKLKPGSNDNQFVDDKESEYTDGFFDNYEMVTQRKTTLPTLVTSASPHQIENVVTPNNIICEGFGIMDDIIEAKSTENTSFINSIKIEIQNHPDDFPVNNILDAEDMSNNCEESTPQKTLLPSAMRNHLQPMKQFDLKLDTVSKKLDTFESVTLIQWTSKLQRKFENIDKDLDTMKKKIEDFKTSTANVVKSIEQSTSTLAELNEKLSCKSTYDQRLTSASHLANMKGPKGRGIKHTLVDETPSKKKKNF